MHAECGFVDIQAHAYMYIAVHAKSAHRGVPKFAFFVLVFQVSVFVAVFTGSVLLFRINPN